MVASQTLTEEEYEEYYPNCKAYDENNEDFCKEEKEKLINWYCKSDEECTEDTLYIVNETSCKETDI